MKKFLINWKPKWATLGDDYLAYAEVYKDAFEELINHPAQLGHHDYAPLPVLFLLRHYIELQLTGLVVYGAFFSEGLNKDLDKFLKKNRRTHSLVKVFEELRKFEEDLTFPQEVTAFISDLEQFDKSSARLRYPESNKGESYLGANIPTNKFLNGLNDYNFIKSNSKVVIECLEGIEAYFGHLKEQEEEERARNREMEDSM